MKNIPCIRVFNTLASRKLTDEYQKAYTEGLSSYGVKGHKTATSWLNNPSVYIIGLYLNDQLIGGSRLHFYNPKFDYPFLQAIKKYKPELAVIMDNYKGQSIAEVCGTWINKDYGGTGLGESTARIGLTLAHHVGIDSVLGLSSRHTLDIYRIFGCHFVTHNDKKATLSYPTNYTSWVIQCETKTLKYTLLDEAVLMKKWLDNNNDVVIVKGKKGSSFIHLNQYKNKIPSTVAEQSIYRSYFNSLQE